MIGAIIGGVASVASGIIGASAAKKEARRANNEKMALQTKLNTLEKNRQEIINPYAGITDLTGMISNPFANLSVATGAAEMQIQEVDISLANTLDTMRATGASAGGATALAQAALKAKKDVSATIEAQEKSNEDKCAQGEQQAQQQKMAEQMRLQGADVAGEQFMFGQREQRQMQELDRTAALLGASKQNEAQAKSDKTSAITGMFGSLASIAGGTDWTP